MAQYALHSKWLGNALEGFTDEQTNQRINPKMNHVKYLAGHLLNSQYGFARVAGVTVERKWDELEARVKQRPWITSLIRQ